MLLGSGEFAVPSFEAIRRRAQELGVQIVRVVSQPDRKSGRGLEPCPTPASLWAKSHGLTLLCPQDVNAPNVCSEIRALGVKLFLVIAFGQRISSNLLEGVAAFNLHGSLLPAWRGAAPIQRSLIACDEWVGVSVIGVAERMDAGQVFAAARTAPISAETAGELHDRLALLGVEPLIDTVAKWCKAYRTACESPQRAILAQQNLRGIQQDESLATRARKFSRADAWVDFSLSAREVAARINGLSPWPGVDALIDGSPLRLLRAREIESLSSDPSGTSGCVSAGGIVACGSGKIELIEVQPPGGRPMKLTAFMNGKRMSAGVQIASKLPESGPQCGGGRAP